jgi:hypothetical protein
MNFNSSTRRRIASLDRLNMIDQYHTDEENIDKRAGISLASLFNEGYPDFQYRNICYDCASQIYHAYKEGSYLAGFVLNRSNKGYRWISPTSVYLPNYAPASSVRDSSGVVYSNTVNDVSGCWNLFKYYGGRDSNLRDWEDVFDDECIRQRRLIEVENEYAPVMEDVDISQDFWKYVSQRKYFKIMVKDVKLKKWESEPEPSLPTVADFRGLVSRTSEEASMKKFATLLANLNINAVREPWFDLFNVPNAKGRIDDFKIHDDNYSKEFVEEVYRKLNKDLYFQSDNKLSWMACEVFTKEIKIVGKKIKPEYEVEYNNATDKIKAEVYNTYPEYYFDCKYELEVSILKNYYSYESGVDTIPMKLVEIPSGNALCEIVKKYCDELVGVLYYAYNAFKTSSEHTRCLEYEPETVYPSAKKIISDAYLDSVTGCQNIIEYCRNTLLPWIDKRADALYAQTTDDENASKFIQSLSKRLNKNTGSLMMWYQNIVSIDQAVEDLTKEKNITTAFIKDMAVSYCYSNTDSSLSCNTFCPNYIDIKPLDTLYNRVGYSFNNGDTVYICDDTHSEIKARVLNVETIYIRSTSYNEATIDENGDLQNTMLVRDKVLRLTLDRKLPTYYCNGNDVSTLRCFKIY